MAVGKRIERFLCQGVDLWTPLVIRCDADNWSY